MSAVAEKLRAKLVEIKKSNPDNSAGVTTCFQTMQKYLANIYKDPSQDKFRNIRLSNPAFQQRVGAFAGSIEALELCGFKVISTHLHNCITANLNLPGMCTAIAISSWHIHGNIITASSPTSWQAWMFSQTEVWDCILRARLWCCLQRSADGDSLSMSQQDAQPEVLTIAGSELNNALNNPFFGML